MSAERRLNSAGPSDEHSIAQFAFGNATVLGFFELQLDKAPLKSLEDVRLSNIVLRFHVPAYIVLEC